MGARPCRVRLPSALRLCPTTCTQPSRGTVARSPITTLHLRRTPVRTLVPSSITPPRTLAVVSPPWVTYSPLLRRSRKCAPSHGRALVPVARKCCPCSEVVHQGLSELEQDQRSVQ